jgi:cysteine desulfurase/selenocysteine lyase
LKPEPATCPGAVSVATGMDWISSEGQEKIFSNGQSLRELLLQELSRVKNLRIYGSETGKNFSDLVSFNINGFTADDLAFVLENSFGIITRAGLHCAPLIHKALETGPDGAVRVSFSAFNTESNVLELAEALRNVASSEALK